MNILTTITICFGYALLALLAIGWRDIGVALVISAVLIQVLNLRRRYYWFFIRVVAPNLGLLLFFNFLGITLSKPASLDIITSDMGFAYLLCAKLWVFASAMFTAVTASRAVSLVLALESRKHSPFLSYILGMSVRAPGLLIEDVQEVIRGLRGRGLYQPGGFRQRLRMLLFVALAFVRVSFVRSESRALALQLMNYFDDSKTKPPEIAERAWESAVRFLALLLPIYPLVLRIL